MSKKTRITHEQQQVVIAERAVTWQQAETHRNRMRAELNVMYTTYFRAHGFPYEDRRKRINPEDPAFDGVLQFTAGAYQRYRQARYDSNVAKRKLRQAIMALERAV